MLPSPSSNLRNTVTFPPFSDLPAEEDINPRYYSEDPRTCIYRPNRHWAFMGEIVDVTMFIRLRIDVKDKSGRVLPVWVHTDDRGTDLAQQCQQGYTLILTYAERHYFMDGDAGIRLEEGASVKVVPYSMAELIGANDIMFEEGRMEKCACCGTKESDTTEALKWCSKCKSAFYCGKECQIKVWGEGHKKDCKVIAAVKWFTDKDWERFEGWWDRRIPQQRAPKPMMTAYVMGDNGKLEPI
ncbi:hypothetical protein PILCRDRAFT_727497 [Piloderma croceum F 1598]|uniref:MYND-type domain-containing protein n=1 Tax=Piloderma croceum (strain F 1598) TaxID=765440 RepID=A0A0C3F0H6_PILCF|nr:hypothetical protein PILCRDRAFT_727497 [Piloderma croceum F 1598]